MDRPPPLADEFAEAARLHRAGDLDRAEDAYHRILAAHPGHADATHLMGVLEHQRGRHGAAVARLGHAIGLAGHRPDYRNNLGVALRAAGRIDEAIAAYRDALRLEPAYPDALANLGVALHEAGHLAEARPPLEAALRLTGDHLGALFALANVLLEVGDVEGALPLYRRAHALAPGRGDILNNLGNALQLAGQADEALATFRRAAAATPGESEAPANLGVALERQDRVEEAADAYAAAARTGPRGGHWPVRIASLCPAVFPSAEAIDRYRVGLEAVLDAHRAGLRLGPSELVASGCIPSFHLAHHGRECRTIKSKFAALFRDAFRAPPPAPVAGPARIGFVVTRRHEGGFLRGTAGIVDRLDPALGRVVIFGEPGGLPPLRAGIRRPDAEFQAIPARLPEAASAIAATGCRVLYHWQIGTDPLNYFLPFAYPAPVQCTSWGTHVTSGIPQVGYYLSSELIEAPGSEAHYTEELVRLGTLPTFQPPVLAPDPPARRSEFGLPESRPLYVCLQRLAKLHPDVDPLLAGILRRDRAGLVVLLEDAAARSTERLRRRLAATMPDVLDRVAFLPRRTHAAYLRLLSLADVVLDPPHYGSGLTAYDALGLGVPLVTMPGRLHVGRYAAGCYRKMGLAEPVAATPDRYVDLAVRLGNDRAFREATSGAIAGSSWVLFEDGKAVEEHARFFERAIAEAGGGGTGEEGDGRA